MKFWDQGPRVFSIPDVGRAIRRVHSELNRIHLAIAILIGPLCEENTELLLAQPGQPKVSPDVGHPLPVETICLKLSPRHATKTWLVIQSFQHVLQPLHTTYFSANKNLVKNQIASRSLQETKKARECIPGIAQNVLWQNVARICVVWCGMCIYAFARNNLDLIYLFDTKQLLASLEQVSQWLQSIELHRCHSKAQQQHIPKHGIAIP